MDNDKYGLKNKTKSELVSWIAEWKPGCEMHLAGMEELRERNQKQDREIAWWAVAISALSLAVALIALFK